MTGSLSALSAILKRATIDDHEEVLRACDVSLSHSKKDLHAQHVKAVALLKLDRHEDAIQHFEACGQELKKRAALEYAYALYKVGDLLQAESLARSINDERGARHVEAQAVCCLLDISGSY